MIHDERIPDCSSRGACKDSNECTNCVVHPGNNNYDFSMVPHERVDGLLWCEEAKIL